MHATQRNATQRNATQRNATQRNATQRNATQRNATQLTRLSISNRFQVSRFSFIIIFFLRKLSPLDCYSSFPAGKVSTASNNVRFTYSMQEVLPFISPYYIFYSYHL
jgi:hypothetical protein